MPMSKSAHSQDKLHKVRSAPQCWRTCFLMLAFSLRSPALIQDFSTLRGEYQFTISISDRREETDVTSPSLTALSERHKLYSQGCDEIGFSRDLVGKQPVGRQMQKQFQLNFVRRSIRSYTAPEHLRGSLFFPSMPCGDHHMRHLGLEVDISS